MTSDRIINLPQLVVTSPRPDRLRFAWRSLTSPVQRKDTYATASLLVRSETKGTSVILHGCFHAYGDRSNIERVIGPFASAAGGEAARKAMDSALGLPRLPHRVSTRELLADPVRFDGMLIETAGTWRIGFESSSFAGAWLIGPNGSGASHERHLEKRVLLRGFWSSTPGGSGHLGVARASLVAYELSELPTRPEKIVPIVLDGVTLHFEQNGDFDEWRLVAAGHPVPMLFKETSSSRPRAARATPYVPVAWLPSRAFVGLRERFAILRSPEGERAVAEARDQPVDVQGTMIYGGVTSTVELDASRSSVRVTLHDQSDTDA